MRGNGPSDRRPKKPEAEPEKIIEIARYIADMTTEMSRLAGAAKLELLAYFLSMARVESEMIARRGALGKDGES